MDKKIISLVISLYNEEQGVKTFYKELLNEISIINSYCFELVWVNDGSKDKTQAIIDTFGEESSTKDITHIKIEFSRNYGHEAAMIAGIDHSTGDAIICLDSDLQHPPSKIKSMLDEYEKGIDLVLMSRKSNSDAGFVKTISSKMFYRLFNKLSKNAINNQVSDFFLISHRISRILQENFRERNRFLRGYIQMIGFNSVVLEFEAPDRVAGESSYSLRSLFKLASVAVFSFSNKPLKLSLYISLLFILITLSITLYSLAIYFFGEKPPSGYTTLIVFQSTCFSILFFLIAILSSYFGKALEEIRDRPIYLVKSVKKI